MSEQFFKLPEKRRFFWALLIFVLFYLPVLLVLIGTFGSKAAWLGWGRFIMSPLFRHTLSFTFMQALVSAVGCILVAFPGAYFFGNYRFRGKGLFRSLFILPFVLPGILVVLAFIVFYGRNGIVNEWLMGLGIRNGFTGLYGWAGIILTHIFYNFPLGVRIIGERWERIDPSFREAAGVLGAKPWTVFRSITAPLLAPAVGYAFLLAFIYSFLSFTVVLVFGGLAFRTFEVLIYAAANLRLDSAAAQAIAVTQLLLLAGPIFLIQQLGKSLKQSGKIVELPRLSFKEQPRLTGIFVGYLLMLFVFFAGPFIGILTRSFHARGGTGGPWTLENYRGLWDAGFVYLAGRSFPEIMGASFGLALAAGSCCVTLAYLIARTGRGRSFGVMDGLAQLPLGASFVTFSFGLYLLAGRALPPVVLVLWAQIFLGFPLVYSMMRLAQQDLGEGLLEAAESLGARGWSRWRSIEWPLLRPALGTGLAFATALSLGDLSSILVLGEGEVQTLPVAIYRLIGQYRFAYALALGTIFILMALAVFLLIEGLSRSRFRRGEGGDRPA